MPGAEPFHHDGGEVGVLLCHGFTGSPGSLRPWAQFLADNDLTVALPRLPGHGTRWQELQITKWQDWYAEVERALQELTKRCTSVFVFGLSMGGALALRLAEEHGDAIAGVVVVNPSVHSENKAMFALRVLKLVVPSLAGIKNDIKKPGQDEIAYDRTPLKAVHSLTEFWALTKKDLPKVTQPLLVFHSVEDHVVEPSNSAYVLAHVGSADLEDKALQDSYHVATLDNDSQAIFDGSLDFVRRLAPAATEV
jgi:carboxylesterase